MTRKNGVHKICQECGIQYYVQAYRAEESKFCSMACVWSGSHKGALSNDISVICRHCGNRYLVCKSRLKKTSYCSRSCSAKARMGILVEAHRIALEKKPPSREPEEVRIAKKKARGARYHEKNKAKHKAQAKAYYEANKERHATARKSYAEIHRDRLREIARQRRAAKAEDARAKRRQHYRDNKARYVAQARSREKHVKTATPPWADMEAITEFYVRREEMTSETGVLHHVDHIVPLKGKNVCGLHVPWNLQVIPAEVNLAKSNGLRSDLAVVA